MKNIIIAGSPRAGKTTLAEKLNEELNYFVISSDKIIATFGRAYPQLDVRLHMDFDEMKDNLAPFIGHFLGVFSDARHTADDQNFRARALKGNRFVLEGSVFNFDIILSVLSMYGIKHLSDRFTLIGLVQNNKTADEFIRDCKQFNTSDDWTYELDDDDLREYFDSRAIPFNREMTGLLTRYGFTVYDTSAERGQVLDQIISDVKSQGADE